MAAFCVFQRAHPKSTWLIKDCSSEFHLKSDLELSHPLQNGIRPFPLDRIIGGFFCQLYFAFAYVEVLLDGSE